jgi:hypothetical protein
VTQELSNTLFLSSIYVVLSLAMIFIVAKENRYVWISSGLYFLLVGAVVWIAGINWLLAGSITLILMSGVYALWVLYFQSKECMRDLEILHKEEKKAEQFKNEEIPHGE